MSKGLTFLKLCLRGNTAPDAIDRFVDRWHDTRGALPLHEYLGMTKEEYALWVQVPDALSYILVARRRGVSLRKIVAEGCGALQEDARAADPSVRRRLEQWLTAQDQVT